MTNRTTAGAVTAQNLFQERRKEGGKEGRKEEGKKRCNALLNLQEGRV